MEQRSKRGKNTFIFSLLCAALLGWLWGPGMPVAGAATEMSWAWMKGAQTVDPTGVYGELGTAAEANTPGGREGALSWTDGAGMLWLFGGYGIDSTGAGTGLNDLWKYDRSTGNWTWIKGASTGNSSGVYGTLGEPDAGNAPGARSLAVSWTDPSGAFWLFGGGGRDAAGAGGYLNDLWKYEPGTGNWTWMRGPSTVNDLGNHGTLGTPAPENYPGCRNQAASWTDIDGNLWLFGGAGKTGEFSEGQFNDLWKYDRVTGDWTWMKGDSTANALAVYGAMGVEDPANTPGARYAGVAWTDLSGAFWLHGGYGYTATGGVYLLNDLWKYDPATGNWTWMKGADSGGQPGIYGSLGVAAPENVPGGRWNAKSWVDPSGALWLFGGAGKDGAGGTGRLNDLWKYNIQSGSWTWMKGVNGVNQFGVYGEQGTPAVANSPCGRGSGALWLDPAGKLWLFGGAGIASGPAYGDFNDLWRVALPDTTPPTGTIVVNNNQTATKTVNVTLALSWDDGPTGSGVSRMKFSNDAVTWSAWEPLAAAKAWTLPAGDGFKTVRAMFRDAAGNNSVVYNDYIRLDTVAPTGGILINNGAATTTSLNVTLKLNWSDGTGSGVTRMRFSDNGATWTAWESQKATRSYTLPAGLGYHTVRVQFTDAASNYSPIYNDYIKVVAP